MPKLCSYILPIILISTFSASADEVVSFYKDLKSDDIKKVKFYNPKPDPDDVIVSLPCDLKMAFRKVYTSTGTDKLQDNTFVAGNASDSSLSQGAHLRHIQGGFKVDKGYYYLVSKYELLKFQVEAIRNNGVCPKITPKNRIPITNISYFDAQDIARQMTLYIQGLGGTKNTLLQQDSFVRMLTDAEWEFAARGGLNVTKEQFSESIPAFNGEELRDIAWYQGPQSSNGRVQLPGLKKPNPLKIYDMLGNVQEMVNDFFNPVKEQRISGQVGGICVRGGSFLTPAQRMSSALRFEKPLINPQNHKEAKALDMGTRFTLASTAVFNDVDEVKQLNKEYSNEEHTNNESPSLSMFDTFLLKIKGVFGSKEENDNLILAESNNETIDSIEQKNSSDNQSNLVSEQDAEVQFNLGLMYSEGQGVKQDYYKAAECFQKAAEQGHAEAQYNLGLMYYRGKGVKQDYFKAIEWYQKAAAQGIADAQAYLAVMYYSGEGVQQDYFKAAELAKKVADQGYAEAQFCLGAMYYAGKGVKQDYTEARRWIEKAAEQGLADAQYFAGLMYASGKGVKQDYFKALEWYKKASEQGYAEAQYNLGTMYYTGKGVIRDYKKAKRWWRLAADQGNENAQKTLVKLFGR